MAFALLNSDLSYWKKQDLPLFSDLTWNIPEQKSGNLVVIGGNSQSFSTPAKISEYLTTTFPFRTVTTVLPDALRHKLPPLANLTFAESTSSGSFARSALLRKTCVEADAVLIIGDLSKNSETAIAIAESINLRNDPKNPPRPLVLTRDAVDLLAPEAERWINSPNVTVVATTAQLQKLLRAIYYPKMLLLSQPLVPVIEVLHKFTLTYPITILTYHQDHIIVAANGEISTTKLGDTDYTPLTLWLGQLAANVTALNFYNPEQAFAATTAAILYH